jgi:DNA-binding IclR family transcriptional regulator
MPRASAHRLCTTLVEGGFVEHVSIHKRYRLNPEIVVGWIRIFAPFGNLCAAFFPLQVLAKQIAVTVKS